MRYLFLLLFLSGCGVNIIGDEVARIYPDDGYGDVTTIKNACPVEITEVTQRPLSSFSGWVCIPEKQFTKYRREWESECNP